MRKAAFSHSLFLLIHVLVGASGLYVAAQQPDGQILSTKTRPALPDYASLDDFARGYFPRAIYDEARMETEFEVLEITYASDGLSVRGVLIRPKAPGPRKWPAILFNRGGNGQLGSIIDNGLPCGLANTSCLDIVDLYQFAKAGFVVIASDYRYQGATAKRDQWGGVEVDDVLNLVPALKSLDARPVTRRNHGLSCDQTRHPGQSRRRHRRSHRRESLGGIEARDGPCQWE